jgi:hypothetical protein
VGNDGVNSVDLLGMAITFPLPDPWYPGMTNEEGIPIDNTGSPAWEEPRCCCIGEPENCEIVVTWTKPGRAKVGIHDPQKPGELVFQAQAYAKVTLVHKLGKDVRGCTLHQKARSKMRDQNVDLSNPADIVKSPPTYIDNPSFEGGVDIVASQLPKHTVHAFFRADVHVKEEPKVTKIWGYTVEFTWDVSKGIFEGVIPRTEPAGGESIGAR